MGKQKGAFPRDARVKVEHAQTVRGKCGGAMDFFWVVWESGTVLFYLEF